MLLLLKLFVLLSFVLLLLLFLLLLLLLCLLLPLLHYKRYELLSVLYGTKRVVCVNLCHCTTINKTKLLRTKSLTCTEKANSIVVKGQVTVHKTNTLQ